jgi:hypothetical protein
LSGVSILPPVCEVERDDPQTNKSSGGTVGPGEEGGVGLCVEGGVGLCVEGVVGLCVVGKFAEESDVGFQVGHVSVGAYVGKSAAGFGVVGTLGDRFGLSVGSCVGRRAGGRGIIVGNFGIPPFEGECVGKGIMVGLGSIVGILGGEGLVGYSIPVGE